MKGHVFDVRSSTLAISTFSITMCEVTDLIGRTYKNGIDVKRFLDRMKNISLLKSKPEMGHHGVTP